MSTNNKCDHATVSRQWDTDDNFIDKWICARCGAEFFHFALDAQPGKITFTPSPEPMPNIRDHFAMAALQAILSSKYWGPSSLPDRNELANSAYFYADAMLKARSA